MRSRARVLGFEYGAMINLKDSHCGFATQDESKLNSKQMSGNLLCLLGTQNKDLGAVSHFKVRLNYVISRASRASRASPVLVSLCFPLSLWESQWRRQKKMHYG